MTRRLDAALALALLAACAGDPGSAPDAGASDAGTQRDAGSVTPDPTDAGTDAGPSEPGDNLSFEFPAIEGEAPVNRDPVAWNVVETGAGVAGLVRTNAPHGAQAAVLSVPSADAEVILTSAPLATIVTGVRYVVRLSVGAPPGGERASIGAALVGGDPGAEATVTSTSIMGDLLPRGGFVEETLTWTAPEDADGYPLRLRLRASSLGGTGSAYVDDVRLVEPAP